jgi:hypothetical protein
MNKKLQSKFNKFWRFGNNKKGVTKGIPFLSQDCI